MLWLGARPEIAESPAGQAYAGLLVLAATAVVPRAPGDRASTGSSACPCCRYCDGIVVVLLVTSVVDVSAFGLNSRPVVDLFQTVVLCLVPVAFVTGVLGGFARTGELDELAEWLGSSGARPDLHTRSPAPSATRACGWRTGSATGGSTRTGSRSSCRQRSTEAAHSSS